LNNVRTRRTLQWIALGLVVTMSGSVLFPVASAHHETSSPVRIDSMSIDVSIRHHYALTTVAEVVTNPTTTAWEFTATLAEPEIAFITRFALETDGLVFESRIEDADAARASYNASVAAHQPAAIVESRGTHIYQVTFNIPGETTVTVHLAYEQLIYRSNGEYRYRFPLVASTAGKTIGALSLHGSLEGTAAIDRASVSLGDLSRPDGTSLAVAHASSHLVPAQDFVLAWTEAYPAGAGTFTTHAGADGTTFVHVFSPDGAGLSGQPLPKDIVFVIDVSGSMDDSLGQVKDALTSILYDLRPADRFGLVTFAYSSATWHPALVTATSDNVNAGAKWVNGLYASGGTNIEAGLNAGLGMLSNEVDRAPSLVLMSDGYDNAGYGDTSLRANLASHNTMGASVYTLAFGSCSNFPLLQAIAAENNGEARVIYWGQDASQQIRGFYDAVSTPLMRGITVTYPEGVESASPVYFARAFAGADLVVVGKLKPGATEVKAEIQGRAASGPITLSGAFDVATSEAGAFVERAWAFARVQDLQNPAVLGDRAAKAELVQLALTYRFVTDYTSLVVVLPPILDATLGVSRGDLRIATSSATAGPPPVSAGTYSSSTPPKAAPGLDALAAVAAVGVVALIATTRRRRST
jgi:uncharacterized protein YegL